MSADGGFRAKRRCWSCRVGVPSRDGTAGLGRPVWSPTTKRKGRSVERPLESRGRLGWRTRCRWGWSASVDAPGAPVGGALARWDHVRMGVDARPRANPPLGSARPGQGGAWSAGRTDRWLIEILRMDVVPVSVIEDDRCGGTSTASSGYGTRSRNSGSPREAEGELVYLSATISPSVSSSTVHRYVTPWHRRAHGHAGLVNVACARAPRQLVFRPGTAAGSGKMKRDPMAI